MARDSLAKNSGMEEPSVAVPMQSFPLPPQSITKLRTEAVPPKKSLFVKKIP